MAVSSKSIIHYTENLDALKSIINDGSLRIKYCLEKIGLYDNNFLSAAFPMVCFCDLPLTLAKDHIKKYGSYGIGFSKVWAREHQLNPVLYLENNSVISKYITEQTNTYMGPYKKVDSTEEVEDKESARLRQNYSRLMAFCKNHEGPLIRNGEIVDKNYIFYDEREWRFVPNIEQLGDVLLGLNANDYSKRKDFHNSLLSNKYLPFNYSDISYIIVKNERDIDTISKALSAKYEDDLKPPVMRKLLTKIISVQQIEDDF